MIAKHDMDRRPPLVSFEEVTSPVGLPAFLATEERYELRKGGSPRSQLVDPGVLQ